MKNTCLLTLNPTGVLMLITLVCSFISCVAFGGEFDPGGQDKMHEESEKTSAWYEKYLYFEMPEEKFVGLFTKDSLSNDSSNPSIISHKGNVYIVKESGGTKYRVTFENGLLTKFEKYGWEKIPLITAAYYDRTYLVTAEKPSLFIVGEVKK